MLHAWHRKSNQHLHVNIITSMYAESLNWSPSVEAEYLLEFSVTKKVGYIRPSFTHLAASLSREVSS